MCTRVQLVHYKVQHVYCRVLQKNYATYKIMCLTRLQVGKKTTYEGETGRNAFTRGQEHQQGLRQKVRKVLSGIIVPMSIQARKQISPCK